MRYKIPLPGSFLASSFPSGFNRGWIRCVESILYRGGGCPSAQPACPQPPSPAATSLGHKSRSRRSRSVHSSPCLHPDVGTQLPAPSLHPQDPVGPSACPTRGRHVCQPRSQSWLRAIRAGGSRLIPASSPKPMRNAETGGAGLHTNGARARREQGREGEGARLQLLATRD